MLSLKSVLCGTVLAGAMLALPLAVAGLGVALFHVGLEVTGRLECPRGVLGLGTAPQQSLTAFLTLTVLLSVESGWANPTWGATRLPNILSLVAAVAVGALLALASCVANPPMPAPPALPYESPPEVCRPPFRTPAAP